MQLMAWTDLSMLDPYGEGPRSSAPSRPSVATATSTDSGGSAPCGVLTHDGSGYEKAEAELCRV